MAAAREKRENPFSPRFLHSCPGDCRGAFIVRPAALRYKDHQLEATLPPRRTGKREEPNAGGMLSICRMDVVTDPEPGMDSGRATVRNVRSKCRCSCVLQFTFRRAVSCVLHRPPSQVIHCTVFYFIPSHFCLSAPFWKEERKKKRKERRKKKEDKNCIHSEIPITGLGTFFPVSV